MTQLNACVYYFYKAVISIALNPNFLHAMFCK